MSQGMAVEHRVRLSGNENKPPLVEWNRIGEAGPAYIDQSVTTLALMLGVALLWGENHCRKSG